MELEDSKTIKCSNLGCTTTPFFKASARIRMHKLSGAFMLLQIQDENLIILSVPNSVEPIIMNHAQKHVLYHETSGFSISKFSDKLVFEDHIKEESKEKGICLVYDRHPKTWDFPTDVYATATTRATMTALQQSTQQQQH